MQDLSPSLSGSEPWRIFSGVVVVLRQSCNRPGTKIAKEERADDCAEKAVPSDFHVFIIGKVLVLWVRCHAFLTYRLVYPVFFFPSLSHQKKTKQTNKWFDVTSSVDYFHHCLLQRRPVLADVTQVLTCKRRKANVRS